ncbi:MAG TPA: hypothetical protein VD816_09240 [Ohtaekwangia sp.]|nr:hypothetical protein [Ohtaekwangia sp.]
MKRYITLILLTILPFVTYSQRQVLVMKHERVIKRYNTGDPFSYSIGSPKNFQRDRIVGITDSTIITRSDTISSHTIKFIHPGEMEGVTLRRIGLFAIAAGIVLPLADWINVSVVQDESYSFDRGVGITSAALITGGAAILIFKKPYIRIRRMKRVMIVDRDSPLYEPVTLPPNNAFPVPEN